MTDSPSAGTLPLMTPRPGLVIRVVATVLDLLLSFFLMLPFAPYVSHRGFLVLFLVLELGYRRWFGATPGLQIVGIRTGRGWALGTTTAARQWLRAAVGLFVILYVGLTVGAGFLISSLTNEKLDARRVAVQPVTIVRPPFRPEGRWQTFRDVALLTPERSRWPAEIAGCCVFYGGEANEDHVNPGSFVYVTADLHPYDYCRGQQSEALRLLSACGRNPLEYQRWISEVTPAGRWKIWNPVEVVRTNFALVAKSMYLEDLDERTPIRRFAIDGGEVLWFQGHRTLKRKHETVQVALDRFLIASPDRFVSVDVLWKKVPRDAGMIERIAGSLTLIPPRDMLQQDKLLSRMNAWRMKRDDATVTEALRAELAASGTQRERRWFATTIASDAQRDPRLRAVAEQTREWR